MQTLLNELLSFTIITFVVVVLAIFGVKYQKFLTKQDNDSKTKNHDK